MKYILIVFMLSANTLRAQVPHIDYMMADEAKSQLQIHGTFSSDTTGFVTIENTKQTVRSWSDTLIICDLPDSGAGSGGDVMVSQKIGTSNARMLSIFSMGIDNFDWYWDGYIPSMARYYVIVGRRWIVNWRADFRRGVLHKIPFEISKSSFGTYLPGLAQVPFYRLPWEDSSKSVDSSISLSGVIDLDSSIIKFNTAKIVLESIKQPYHLDGFDSIYHPFDISFDTNGNINGYINDNHASGPNQKILDSLYNTKILFPPSIKNAVAQAPQPSSDLIKIFSHIGSEDNLISLEAEVPLGETMASLYSIDGRLLKQEKISIPSAGKYSFDASGIYARVGFLVLKTEKGIIAGKVLF